MGQAKQRGTFEQRQAEGIAKREKELAARKKAMEDYEASLTPAQKKKRHDFRMIVAAMAGVPGLSFNY